MNADDARSDPELREAARRIAEAQVEEVAREAVARARAEVIEALKELLVEPMLSAALRHVEATGAGGAQPSVRTPHAGDDERARLRAEIDAVRDQLSANEALLEGSPQASPSEQGRGSRQGIGYYVYCIRRAGLPLPPIAGIAGTSELESVGVRDFEAVVSKVDLEDFNEDALAEMAGLEPAARDHERVLDALLDSGGLLPMRFGTVYGSVEQVEATLAAHHDGLRAAFERVQDRREWGIKVHRDAGALHQWVLEANDELREKRDEAAALEGGTAYWERKRLDTAAEAVVESVVNEAAHASHQQLSQHAVEATINPVRGPLERGRSDVILNGAYLVERATEGDFVEAVEELRQRFGDRGLDYELTGPWPPYNFTTMRPDEP